MIMIICNSNGSLTNDSLIFISFRGMAKNNPELFEVDVSLFIVF